MEHEVKEKSKKYGKYEDYEIESAADAIQRAEEIKSDPEKMKYVEECLKEKYGAAKKAVKSIKDLRDARDEVEEDDDE